VRKSGRGEIYETSLLERTPKIQNEIVKITESNRTVNICLLIVCFLKNNVYPNIFQQLLQLLKTPERSDILKIIFMDTQPSEDKVVRIGKYNVKVIRAQCIGAGPCVAISPDTFELDKENKAIIKEASADTPENILMAAQACPAQAIVIEDAETHEKIWPA
jgi:ferredoxin